MKLLTKFFVLFCLGWLRTQITAVFASGGDHTTPHAHWGYYMIAAVAVQVFTGFMRTKGLEAKHANFSYLHRVRVSKQEPLLMWKERSPLSALRVK